MLIQTQNIIPSSQFRFEARHPTVHLDLIHRLTDQTSSLFEKKTVFCRCVFRYIADLWPCIWHKGLLYKLKIFLSSTTDYIHITCASTVVAASYYLMTKFYLKNCTFMVRQFNYFSSYFCIQSGVPQGLVVTSPQTYTIFLLPTCQIQQMQLWAYGTYADDILQSSLPEMIQFKPLIRYKII